MMPFPGTFFLLLGPSGVGKGTVITALKKEFEGDSSLFFPVTATTREPRPREQEGRDYYFLSREAFEEKIKSNDFLEYAVVHGQNYYGLPKSQVFSALSDGKKVVRELDIQGLWNIQKILPPENIVSLFLYPESLEVLKNRIIKRSPLPPEEVERRLKTAENEMKHMEECTFQILSKDGSLKEMISSIKKIILEYPREKGQE